MKTIIRALFTWVLIYLSYPSFSCTIVSAVAEDGQVWTMNNEDGHTGIANFINVFPVSDDHKFGYYTLSYFSPGWGEDGRIQGGMNEKGLTFDFNTIDPIDFDFTSRQAFPQGDDAILPYILGNLSSVDEVIAFFDTYWFQGGFTSAQMHVADKQGNFAIISASGVMRSKNGTPMISTNFDLCGKQNSSTCERYAMAKELLEKNPVSYETMFEISEKTAQGESTLDTNIQNLSTGDIWFMSKHDPGTTLEINIADLLEKGRKSFTFSHLNEVLTGHKSLAFANSESTADLSGFTGTYHNQMIGNVRVERIETKLRLTFDDHSTAVFSSVGNNAFKVDEALDVFIVFQGDELQFYENDFWSFTALKTTDP
jgi:hypothetical protein